MIVADFRITREQIAAHPIAWLVQQRLLHPLTKKPRKRRTCEAFKMALQDGLEPTTP